MVHLMIYMLTFLFFMLPFSFGEVSSQNEVGIDFNWGADSSQIKILRPYGIMQLDTESEEGLYSFNLSLLAWQNLAADEQNKLDRSRVEARSAILNFFADNFLISVGQMTVDWGETFGYRPSDIVNPRDLRNFSPLNLDDNKIPLTALRVAASFGLLHGELVYSPLSQYTLLPKEIGGITLDTPRKNEVWFNEGELGFKAGFLLDSANIDFFVYRHLNRLPSLLLNTISWVPLFESINSFGINAAFSFERSVLRLDGMISTHHPILYQLASDSLTYGRYITLTAGFDWTFENNALLGIQAHYDRYPITQKQEQYGLSMQAQYDISDYDSSIEASVYRGFIYKDQRDELKVKTKLGSHMDISVGSERMHWGHSSPMAIVANSRSYTGKLAYQF